jgi:DHA1 family bicyclomycin/chloramphenicol resistance-like MFS transporter
MEPLGHVAGLGSAIIGSLSTFISVVFGVIIANAYDNTVLPLIAGFAILGLAGLLAMRWTDS